MEGAPEHQSHRTHARRAPAAHQNAGDLEHRTRHAQSAARVVSRWHHSASAHRWLYQHHRDAETHEEGGIMWRAHASALFHNNRSTTLTTGDWRLTTAISQSA